MSITSKNLLNLLYYKKLPKIYQDADARVDYQLKRYLESLIDGGFCGSIEDIERVLLLVDPETIPEEFLPYLYASFGLEYFPDISATYQRKLLLNLGELMRRRGTFSCVRFLIKVLTGLESELSFENGELIIVLLAKTIEQINSVETSMYVIENLIRSYIPYFVNIVITSRVDTQIVSSKSYSHSSIGSHKFYSISTGGK